MYNTAKACAAQEAYCKDGPNFTPRGGQCPRCKQNIFSEWGHPVSARLQGGRVLLSYGEKTHGITVEEAGRERVTGCPFCHWSFCE